MSNVYESNIWKYYLLRIFSAMELTIAIFVLFLFSNNLTMTQVMSLETIFIILVLFLEIPSGAFADIFGRKLSLSISIFCATISFIIFGLGNNYMTFLIAQIFLALNWSFFSGTGNAFIYDSLKKLKLENRYSEILGKASFYNLLTLTIVSLISGLLVVYLGYRTLFFISAFISFLGFLTTLLFKEPTHYKKIYKKNYFKHIISSVKFSFHHKTIRNLIIYYGLFASFGYSVYFLIQPFYEISNLPIYVIGIATSLYFLNQGIGSLLAEKIFNKIKGDYFLLKLLLISGLSFIGLFLFNKIIALFFISIIALINGIRDIIVSKRINNETPSSSRATIMSVQSISRSLMYAVFAPLIGYLTDIFSPSAAFFMMGIGLFLFLIYYLILSWIYKESPAL